MMHGPLNDKYALMS